MVDIDLALLSVDELDELDKALHKQRELTVAALSPIPVGAVVCHRTDGWTGLVNRISYRNQKLTLSCIALFRSSPVSTTEDEIDVYPDEVVVLARPTLAAKE